MNTDLRSRRDACGLTRQAVAHEAGCSLSMLQMLESGYRPSGESAVLDRVEAVLAGHEANRVTDPLDADGSSSASEAAA